VRQIARNKEYEMKHQHVSDKTSSTKREEKNGDLATPTASLGSDDGSMRVAQDVLDEAVPLTDLPVASLADDDTSIESISEEEHNASGGALPASDDGDNDNDNDDERERNIPDHLRRDPDDR
jgi:hypothetical protein